MSSLDDSSGNPNCSSRGYEVLIEGYEVLIEGFGLLIEGYEVLIEGFGLLIEGFGLLWSHTDEIPVILGRANFFMLFDVCFYRSQMMFEIRPNS
jgi:hypothetical protein